ncbi:MAG TPA: tetratricopeptide repeat protein [Ktedonobacterales bacterium]
MTSEEADYRLHEALLLALGGSAQEARDALSQLANRRLSSRQRARLQSHVALLDLMQGHSDDARRAAEEGLDVSSRLPDSAVRVRLRMQLGQAMETVGNPQAALDQFRNGLGELEQARSEGRASDPTLLFEVLLATAGAEMALKRSDAAIDHLEQATRLAADNLRPEQLGQTYRSLSAAHFQQGDLSGAEEYALRGIAAYEAAARRRQGVVATQRLASAYVGAGRPGEAISHLLAGIKAAEQQGDSTSEAALQAGLARAHLDQKKVDDARTAAKRAVTVAQHSSDKHVQAQAYLAQSLVQDASDDLAGEEKSLDRAIALLREGPPSAELSDAYAQLSSLLERRGEPQRALEILKQALRLRESGSMAR